MCGVNPCYRQTSNLEERRRLYPQVVESFAAYGALTTPPIEQLDIAFDPAPLPAYLRLPHTPAADECLPVIVLVQKLDTIKEMDDFLLWDWFADHLAPQSS